MKTTSRLRHFLLGSFLLAAPSVHATTYTWANANVTGLTPPSSLNWLNATQGSWTGGTPASGNTNTIQFFQDTTTALPNTGASGNTQTSVIDTLGDVAFELGTLTLSGFGSTTSAATLTMTIQGDPLNFSAATGTINLNSLINTAPVVDTNVNYNLNSAIQLGTGSTGSVLTIQGNGTSVFNIGGIISELDTGGGSLIKSGTSTVSLTGANSYTGTTAINQGTLTVSGASGTINLSSGVTVGSGATLGLNNALGSVDRIKDAATLTLNGGTLIFTGRGSTASTTETIDTLAIGAGGTTLTLTGAGAGQLQTLSASAFSRTGNGTALIRGTSLQTLATNATRLSITGGTGLDLVGGGTENNGVSTAGTTTTLSIVPYFIGDTNASNNGSSFLTYDTSGALRPLATGEYTTLAAGYTTPGTAENVKAFSGTITTGSLVTVNSLLFSTTTQTLVGTGALRVNSGAIAATAATGIINGFTGITLGNGTWNEGIITATGTNVFTVNVPISVSGSGKLVKAGAGTLALTGNLSGVAGNIVVNSGTLRITDTNFTGGFVINGGALGDNSGVMSTAVLGNNNITANGVGSLGVAASSSMNGGISLNAGSTLSIASNNSNFTVNGAVTGAGNLAVSQLGSGNNTLNLNSTANNFTGRVDFTNVAALATLNVNSFTDSATPGDGNIRFGLIGTAAVAHTFALSAGAIAPLTINNRQFEIAGTGSIIPTISNNSSQAFTINSDLLASGTGTRTLTLGGTGAGLSTFAGDISNGSLTTLSLTKAGTGTWTLSGTNTYNGATTVSAGLLNVTGTLTSNVTVSGTAFLSGTGTTTGTLALGNGTTIVGTTTGNSFKADTVTATSAVKIAGSDGSGSIGSHTIGVVRYNTGTGPTTANFSTTGYHAGASVANVGGAGGETQLTYTNEARTWNSASSTWDVMSTNAWVEGDKKFGHGDALTFNDTGTGGGAARAVTLNSLVTPGSVTFNNTTSTYTVSGTGTIAGLSGLTKSGNGMVTLSTNNTYTGATTVSAGTLQVSGTGAINSTSSLTVSAGAKLAYNSSTALTVAPTLSGSGLANRAVLGGTGPINASVTLDNVGDTLSPGNSPGIEPFTVGQSWAAFSYDWEVNDFSDTTGLTAGSDFDQIGITGGLTLTGAAANSYYLNILSLTAGNVTGDAANFSEINRSWNILTTTTGITGFNASFWNLNSTGFTNAETGTWSLAQSGNNLVLSYTVVPEPRAALLGGLGMLILLRRRRK